MTLEGHVRGLVRDARARHWLRTCNRLGAGVSLDGRPTIGNQGQLRIGDRFHLASLPVASHIWVGPEGALEIGDDVSIAHGAGIAASARLEIGSGTRIAPFATILDTDFHVAGDRSGQSESSAILIGRGVRIGSNVTILRGSEIGDRAIIEAASVVSGKVPAGARVAGVPARPAPLRGEIEADGLTELDVARHVPEVVMRSFGLSSAPAPEDGPGEIPQWDSLGALRLLLSLEVAFGVTLNEDDMIRAGTVADLATIIGRAVSKKASTPAPDEALH